MKVLPTIGEEPEVYIDTSKYGWNYNLSAGIDDYVVCDNEKLTKAFRKAFSDGANILFSELCVGLTKDDLIIFENVNFYPLVKIPRDFLENMHKHDVANFTDFTTRWARDKKNAETNS